jgi:hypothetical protein
LNGSGGKTTEWKSQVLRNYLTRAADALIAGAYLAGTNTRRVRRALRSVFGGEVGRMAHLLFPGGVLDEEKPWEHAEAVARTAALMADRSLQLDVKSFLAKLSQLKK